MARVKLSQEFKDAISELPDKEKDKLLFRLLPKEPDLVEQLSFRLLEDGLSIEDRRDELGALPELLLLAWDSFIRIKRNKRKNFSPCKNNQRQIRRD